MNIEKFAKNNNLRQSELEILIQIIRRIENGEYKIPIRDIAKSAYVSTSSIVRLAKKLGYNGYSEILYGLKNESIANIEYNMTDTIRSIIILEESLNVIDRFIESLLNLKKSGGRIHVLGIGYSDYAARYFCDKLLELDYYATTKSPLDFSTQKSSLLLFISESGETNDLIFIEKRCRSMRYQTFFLCANRNSTLCKNTSNHIIIKKGREKQKFTNYFIGNSVNLIESILAILDTKKECD